MRRDHTETISLAGHETFVERCGDGPRVLCLHAIEFGAGPEEWRPLATRLAAAGYQTVAPSWPLSGRVTPDCLHTWLGALLHHYHDAVDWLARGQAAAYAIAAGQRCRSLAVISPDGLHPEPVRDEVAQQLAGPAYDALTTREAVAAWLAEQYSTPTWPGAELDDVAARMRRPGAREFCAAWASGALRLDVRREWIALTQPLLLLWGELADDPPLSRVDDWLMPLRPDAPVMMIRGRPLGVWKRNVTYKSFAAGPRPHVEQPEAVAKVVVEHLANASR